jgi:two-component system, NtrC family, sensor kinase
MAAERLEAAGRLAAWLAHQINNPLGAISGNAQLLARRLQRDISDPDELLQYLRYLDGIQGQTERCARITGEILNFARTGEPDLRRIDVRQVIGEAIELVSYAHPGSNIAFDSSDILPEVCADREWMTRMVFELLSNAVESSAGAPVSVNVTIGPRDVRISVRDLGPGIPDDVLPRIFDPFFSTRERARGLGLTLCLEMARRMGGSLHVERPDDGGSVFTAAIPAWGRRD